MRSFWFPLCKACRKDVICSLFMCTTLASTGGSKTLFMYGQRKTPNASSQVVESYPSRPGVDFGDGAQYCAKEQNKNKAVIHNVYHQTPMLNLQVVLAVFYFFILFIYLFESDTRSIEKRKNTHNNNNKKRKTSRKEK